MGNLENGVVAEYDLRGAWLTLPKGINPKKQPGPDFDTFSFEDQKKHQVLFVYIGFHPSFPSAEAPKNQKPTLGKLNGMKTHEVAWRDKKFRHREILVQLDKNLVAHCIYRAASDADAHLSQTLLATLRRQRQDKMRP